MNLQCLIVDDEQLAREMLEAYAFRIPELKVIAKCKSVAETQTCLSENKIDLLFLDIQMPRMTGVEFLRQLTSKPKVIFTTAYSSYALEGYELEVIDYLLKPIGFERFEKAVNRAKKLLSTEQKAQAFEDEQTFEHQFLIIKDGYNHQQVFLKDILYISAMREYVQYHTKIGKVMELNSLLSVEKRLPDAHFIRIHRSYIVAKASVKRHEQNSLLLHNEVTLPLGRTYKQRALGELF